jgi:hypothetical protein
MKLARSESLQDILQQVRAALRDQRLPEIDFDRLQAALDGLAELEDERARVVDELSLLREDYAARIAGMLKAVAVVGRRRDAMSEISETINALPHLTAEQLIAQYGKTAARFRDAFPSSFPLHRQTRAGAVQAPQDYR